MGYHFVIRSFTAPSKAAAGDTLEMQLKVENTGVAPIYHRLPLCIRLTGEGSSQVFETEADITRWLPGEHEETLTIILPEGMNAGTYAVELGVDTQGYPQLYFATDAPRADAFYRVGEVSVG